MFVYSPNLKLNLPLYGIDVPLLDKRREKVAQWIEQQIKRGRLRESDFVRRDFAPAAWQELALVHDEEFLKSCRKNPEQAAIAAFELVDKDGNYNRYRPQDAQRDLAELINTGRSQVGATLYSAELALQRGFVFHLGGGGHHAMTFGGRGFCQFHDVAVAIKSLIKRDAIQRAWIVDVDAHKGDGQAQIFEGDSSVGLLSIHMARGWPLDGEERDQDGALYPWFIPSDVDIPVEEGEERLYLDKLEAGLLQLREKFPRPDLAVVVAGSDPYCEDELESASGINLSLEQMLERDLLVYNFLRQSKTPQLYVMAGGYGARAHEPYLNFLENVVKDVIINR